MMAEEQGTSPATGDDLAGGLLGQDEIEALLNQTESAVDTLAQADAPPPTEERKPDVATRPFVLEDLKTDGGGHAVTTLGQLRDVDLNVQIELGRTQMIIEDVLRLRRGSVVALDKLAGDPVDIYANGFLIARGEVLVLNENFCVRITEIVSPATQLAAG